MTPDQVRGDGDQVRNDGPAPLIVTAELPADLLAWANAMRRLHYPPERNRVDAHVTLFHALPPSCEEEVRELLSAAARDHAPVPARLAGVMSLGHGTALRIESPAMTALRRELADRLHGLLSVQDAPEPRLHITIQNKVSPREASALQEQLAGEIVPRGFRFPGLALHRYRGGPWETVRSFAFRGRNGA